MAILDMDIGNSRLKWRCGELRGALLHEDNWQQITGQLAEVPARVRVANVAGDTLADRVSQWCLDNWRVKPEFAATGPEAAGVRCGYPDPRQLGVDRWLAILAGYHKYGSNVTNGLVVVSAGSAVTVDLLKATGEHLGGYIVPGLEMQRRALFTGTSAVKVPGQWRTDSLAPGCDTGNAVTRGAVKMVITLVEAARNQLGAAVPVLVCGGDADYLLPHLHAPALPEPELVLDGLSVLMP